MNRTFIDIRRRGCMMAKSASLRFTLVLCTVYIHCVVEAGLVLPHVAPLMRCFGKFADFTTLRKSENFTFSLRRVPYFRQYNVFDVIEYSDLFDVLADFRDVEVSASTSPVLLRKNMVRIYQRIAADENPFSEVLKGVSGVGKTTTLLAVGHMARKAGCLVLPIQGDLWMQPEQSMHLLAHEFLLRWKAACGELFLSEIMCPLNVVCSLLELIDSGLQGAASAEAVLYLLIDNLMLLEEVPVVILIDQCNAFLRFGSTVIHPIWRPFSQWSHCHMRRGCILYSFSPSLNIVPSLREGSGATLVMIEPLREQVFRRLINLLISRNHLPASMGNYTHELFLLCGGLPRELEIFALLCQRADEQLSFEEQRAVYLDTRKAHYRLRFLHLLLGPDIDQRIRNESLHFCRRWRGRFKFSRKVFPPAWTEAGLVMTRDGAADLSCPAAKVALEECILDESVRDAIASSIQPLVRLGPFVERTWQLYVVLRSAGISRNLFDWLAMMAAKRAAETARSKISLGSLLSAGRSSWWLQLLPKYARWLWQEMAPRPFDRDIRKVEVPIDSVDGQAVATALAEPRPVEGWSFGRIVRRLLFGTS